MMAALHWVYMWANDWMGDPDDDWWGPDLRRTDDEVLARLRMLCKAFA